MENSHNISNLCTAGPLAPTPVNGELPLRADGYASLLDALEYAAEGDSGFNFYDQRGELECVLSYTDLRDQAKVLASRLAGSGAGAVTASASSPKPIRCSIVSFLPASMPA